jgi:hypothetical protein
VRIVETAILLKKLPFIRFPFLELLPGDTGRLPGIWQLVFHSLLPQLYVS